MILLNLTLFLSFLKLVFSISFCKPYIKLVQEVYFTFSIIFLSFALYFVIIYYVYTIFMPLYLSKYFKMSFINCQGKTADIIKESTSKLDCALLVCHLCTYTQRTHIKFILELLFLFFIVISLNCIIVQKLLATHAYF